jgi:serine/threonine-protein kinase
VADDPRVQRLLDELLDTDLTPEVVCRNHPELLAHVRHRWEQMRSLEAQLDVLFPTPGPDSALGRPIESETTLPRIPGYDVQAVLGRGGMGVVFKARHLRLNRFVALKVLITGAYASPEERTRFQREAEAVASLRHPGIVQIHDVGDHDGWPYFTMELLDGGNLAQALAGKPQPARKAARMVTTLAEAIHAAHQGGIVHRDLKPSNVLLAPDGNLKIADFGVARHVNEEAALTLSGARIGTPSYMAPEQVVGKSGKIGPAVDIYALGTVLYELLTGRPPFRADSVTETQRQVVSDDPVRPARLNPKVPRDLETICLKCLEKNPERRYATAAALADDLKRFQNNEPIAARRAGLFERIVKWARRHPARAATLATSLLLALVIIGGSVRLAVEQARRRDAVYTDFKESAALQDSARWAEAGAALDRAADQLGGGGPADLRRRLGQARRELNLVVDLDSIRLNRVTRGELTFYKAKANLKYGEAFSQAGLGTPQEDPSRVGARIAVSAVRKALVAAVFDWSVCAPDQPQRAWLFEVVQQADPSTDDWRKRALDPAAWDDRAALAELAETAPVSSENITLLLALGERLRASRNNAAAFLRRVQSAHPADFWANLILGNATLQSAPQEAAGYYRASLASRPQAPVGYCAVGDTMRLQQLPDQAIDYYEKALALDPNYARAHSNLGAVLHDRGRYDEAIDRFQTALRLDPDYAWAHWNFANTLRARGRLDEACDQYRQVLRVDPQNPQVHYNLACVLVPQGREKEARAGWREALDANPPSYGAWSGYPELCLFLGLEDEYRAVRSDLLARFGNTSNPAFAEPLSRACSLARGTEDEREQAAALADRAVAAGESTAAWIRRYHLFAKGLAEYRQGRLEGAINIMEGDASRVMGPAPRLILAMAQHDQGKGTLARKTLAKAVIGFDWNSAQADSQDVWIAHILRREAEALILPTMSAVLRGESASTDNDERLALVGVCQFQRRYDRAARFFADAVADDPSLAAALEAECRSRSALGDTQSVGRLEDLSTECRYPVARCAILAGFGLGEGGAELNENQRANWRQRALEWLRSDLILWASVLESPSEAARARVRKVLMQWQIDPDLAGVRDSSLIEKLPGAECQQWRGLWESVGNLLKRTNERTVS